MPSWRSYKLDPLKFFAGYMHIKYANPSEPVERRVHRHRRIRSRLRHQQRLHRMRRPCRCIGPAFATRVTSAPRSDRGLLRRIIRTPMAPGSRRAARRPRTAPAAEASTLFPSTPTTASTSTSMLTWAPCTAACTTVRPAATSHDQHQPHHRRALQVLSATRNEADVFSS